MNQASQILAEVKKAVCGKDRVLVWVLTVILAKGHILLDKPLQTAASELCDSVFSEYHTVVDGVAVDYTYTDTITDSVRTQYSYTLTLRRVQR